MSEFISFENTRITHIEDAILGTNSYHLIYCKTPFSLLAIQSGPPIYIFNERNQFVGWSPNSGEGVSIQDIIVSHEKGEGSSVHDEM